MIEVYCVLILFWCGTGVFSMFEKELSKVTLVARLNVCPVLKYLAYYAKNECDKYNV